MNEQRIWRVFGWIDYEDIVRAETANEAINKVVTRLVHNGITEANAYHWRAEEATWDNDGFLRE